MTDLGSVRILEVWHALGGPEPKKGRAPAWWRDSRDFNVSIDAQRNVFYDHVTCSGGGVLTLVETVLACSRAEALDWLERHGFIEPRALSPAALMAHKRTKKLADSVAPDVVHWHGAFLDELNTAKLAAVDAGDDDALQRAASACNVLENGAPAIIAREFVVHFRRDAAEVARLIEAGKSRERAARRVTAAVVLTLARDARAEDFNDAA